MYFYQCRKDIKISDTDFGNRLKYLAHQDENGEVQFTSKHKEVELREGDDHKDFVHAFNGYAPAGDVEVDIADVVYTHYARVEDLQELGRILCDSEKVQQVSRNCFFFQRRWALV